MNSEGYYPQYYRPARRQDHHHRTRNGWVAQKASMPMPQPTYAEPNPWAQDMMTMMVPPQSTPMMPVQALQPGYQTPPMAPVTPQQALCEMSPPPVRPQQHYPGPYVWLLMIPIGYRGDGTYGPLCPFPPFASYPGGPCEEYCTYTDASGSFSPHPDQNFGQ
ncbi:uncharacterized protein LOC124155778 [Ischnura elegans]|uniref:uncharacterized protein LOC124155778 n=1 Tax=Ischnura elegans TaxID=197161 RepID=UPI001ED8BF60|nr:uncharacterized protein LOC124155778 [Ischnura elegans]